MPQQSIQDYSRLTSKQTGILLISILIVALCGIAYELIISSVSSYLLGNSVFQFSMTIGFFMFAMGVGSFLTRLLGDDLIRNFISIEIALSLVGGVCSLLLMIVFPQARVLYEAVMYSLILIIGALVGMEIPILTSILSQKQNIRDSISNVMSFDYLGALAGAVIFPLFLLPHLGLIRSSFAIGLINSFIALINIFMFRRYLRHPRLFMGAALLVIMLLVAFLLYGSVLTRFAEKHLYFDDIIYQQQTLYQQITVTRSAASGDTRLYIDGHIQFSSRDEYRYHEALVHPLMSIPGSREHVLILGGGDGLAAREILKHEDVRTIHLVDIDPEMTLISRQLPVLSNMNGNSLDDPRLTVFNDDAFSFINRPGMLYDRVIVDMPDPHNEAINKLYSREFYTMIRRRMTPQGVLVTQSSSPFFTRKTFWCIEQTLASVFEHTLSYHNTIPSFGVWGFNMARNGTPLPRDYEFKIPTRYLDRAVMDAALIFGKDTQKLASPVNSILEPKLYQLYIEDLKS